MIRRMDDGRRSYTAIMLPGEPARIFPTSDWEHARILEIYKQDKAHPGVLNDFTDYALGAGAPPPARPAATPRRRRRASRKRE